MGIILALLLLINLNVAAVVAHAETRDAAPQTQEQAEESKKPSNYELFLKATDFIKSLWQHMQDDAPEEDPYFPHEDTPDIEGVIEAKAPRAPPFA